MRYSGVDKLWPRWAERVRLRARGALPAAVAAMMFLAVAAPGQEAAKPIELKGVRIDRAKRQVVLDAKVSQQEGMLEFLLCTAGTKDYESLLKTDVKPSTLHAAILALGLRPGKPAEWTTLPGQEPVFAPPRGAQLDITLRTKDKDGKVHEVPATDWLLVAGGKKAAKPSRWVFVGSNILDDGKYWADVDGHHISVANFASSVIDVPFESSDKNALRDFAAEGKKVPAKDTPVEVVITALAGQDKAEVARLMMAVDRLGRIVVEDKPAAPEDIEAIAKAFLQAHAKGAVEVLIDPRAMVFDRERLKGVLEQAGVTDITFRTQGFEQELLPRTAEQLARAMTWWKEQFAQAGQLLTDPAEDAEAVLKQIAEQRRQLEEMGKLWGRYAEQLDAAAKAHKAAQAAKEKQP